MSKRERKIGQLAVFTLLASGVLLGLLTFKSAPIYAHVVPSPCDFTTGGGYVLNDDGTHVNFGIVGGCKNGGFFGHVNIVNHQMSGFLAGLHVSSTSIDGYFTPFIGSNIRDICGTAKTNLAPPFDTGVKFRVRTLDGGEPGSSPTRPPTGPDRFGVKLCKDGSCTTTNFNWLPVRFLAGGNIQLHKHNNSNTGPNPPPDEITACGSDDSGLGS